MLQKNLLLLTCLSLSACSTTTNNASDPLEAINRPIFHANNVIDHTLLRPTVLLYDNIAPLPIKTGVANFYRNMSQITSFINHSLQLESGKATANLGRFLINGTLGFGGIFDVATELGIAAPKQDFGQTFSQWGWKNSTYVVLPIIGPSTLRDGIGSVANMLTSPQYYLLKKPSRNEYFAISLIDKRLQLTNLDSVLSNAGVDQYAFVRSSFLQNRNYSMNSVEDNSKDTNGSMTSGPPE